MTSTWPDPRAWHPQVAPVRVSLMLLTFALACLGCGDPCDAGDVRARLSAAEAGEVVTLPACRLEAALEVPAGVSLRGTAGSHLVGPTDGPAVTLTTGAAGPSALEEVRITARHTGVLARGDGDARIRGVTIEAERGVAVHLEAAGETRVTDTTLQGTVNATNRDDSRWLSVTASEAPTHGLVASRGTLRIARSRIEGFAWLAVALGTGPATDPLEVTLSNSVIGRGLGIGLATRARTLALEDTSVEDVWTGIRGWPSYGVFVEAGAVTSSGLSIARCDGYGLVQIAGEATHAAPTVTTTGDVGVWLGEGVTATLAGPGARIEDTAFAAIAAVDASRVTLRDLDVVSVRSVRRTVLVRGGIEIGDGIELIGSAFSLTNVSVTGAERLGLLVDAGASFTATDLRGVTVTSEGAGLGAILGSVDRVAEEASPSTATPGWDADVTRVGAAVANDPAFAGSLAAIVAPGPPSTDDVLGVIAPMY
ncbi:MAG: hypothetical protein ACK6CU_15950 [Deltaproteobacteria bacterium]